MRKSISWTPLVAAVSLLFCGAVAAKVPAAEADQLGKDLNCVGGEMAASKDGLIPAFSGKWLGTPPGIKYTPHVGEFPPDPYAGEKPILTITAANVTQYADKLSEGQKALFAKYKDYRMEVYPSHRDFRYPDNVCEIAKKNALNAEITDNGLGVKGALKGAVPFPIAKDGQEALMNNTFPTRAFTEETIRDLADVLPDGSVVWGRQKNLNLSEVGGPGRDGKPLEGTMAYSMALVMAPERQKGSLTVSEEPVNFAKNKRLAWTYDPGTRRVRQLPEYGFDQPVGGTDGKMTIDSDRLFNGSPERYSWKLLGKREMYVPEDSYKVNGKLKYADLLKAHFPNSDYIRWELRRVWVLEGTLKPGYRHLYAKRVLFLDEDDWQAVMSDFYDARGSLWQYAFINHYYAYDMDGWQAGASFYIDLNSGGYVGYNLFGERDKGPILNKGDLTPSMFTPQAARNAGN